MSAITVYNLQGNKTGTMEVDASVFGVKVKPSVIHQVYIALMANLREPWAHTKDRGEVRGGGKKPWKQKGTGRARHGSIRSPLWKGGGVTFGPLKTRNYKQKINKKMNQAAMRMCLSDRAGEEKFMAIEALPVEGKTKIMAALRDKLPGSGKSTLLVADSINPLVSRAIQNLSSLDIARAQDINVAQILNHQYIIATKEAVHVLEKRLAVSAINSAV